MNNKNPYTISFGKIPNRFISRRILIDSIIEALNGDDEQAFKLTGIRGTGKTVTLTAIEKELRKDDDWIVIGLRSDSDIIRELVAALYSSVPFLSSFIDANINLSLFGIGISLSKIRPVASIDYALKVILHEIKKRNKRLLVTIDEARKTHGMTNFIQEFQLLIREELPIYLIIAGLYEDIESIENTDGLTFFLRAAKYEMTPLNYTYIRDDYRKTLDIPLETAEQMAAMTKGYAYAYQALGKYMWDSSGKVLTDDVLQLFDEALAEKVYKKIWSELTEKDKWFMQYIVRKDSMSASELLQLTGQNHNSWSVPRARLKEKGIIDVETRGIITVKLPRFKEFVNNRIEMPYSS